MSTTEDKPREKLIHRRIKHIFVYENKRWHKLPPLMIVTLLIIFAGAGSIATSMASVTMAKAQEAVLTQEVADVEQSNNNLRNELEQAPDLSVLKQKAAEAGMNEPQPYQIIHFTVPAENYAEINESDN
jgi:cell division protein FtsB